MKIREYKANDCDRVVQIFYETVHSVNAKDYTKSQLNAWAISKENFKEKKQYDLLNQKTLVAEIDGKIAGFGSIDKDGTLDLLFVDRDFQRQGIATMLCNELEKGFDIVTTYASITAKKFFENRGYELVKSQEVLRYGEVLKNFKMQRK